MTTEEEQTMKALQSALRTEIGKSHGLSEELAGLIPLGAAEDMLKSAGTLATTLGAAKPTGTQEKHSSVGDQGNTQKNVGDSSVRPKDETDAYLNSRYPGPQIGQK